jgi:hypothetical protein
VVTTACQGERSAWRGYWIVRYRNDWTGYTALLPRATWLTAPSEVSNAHQHTILTFCLLQDKTRLPRNIIKFYVSLVADIHIHVPCQED